MKATTLLTLLDKSLACRHQIFIIMESCSGGDLYSRDPYTEDEAARIISSCLSAISYMHKRQIIHRVRSSSLTYLLF